MKEDLKEVEKIFNKGKPYELMWEYSTHGWGAIYLHYLYRCLETKQMFHSCIRKYKSKYPHCPDYYDWYPHNIDNPTPYFVSRKTDGN